MPLTRRIAIVAILTATATLLFALPALAALTDVKGNWAESAIRDLYDARIVTGYPDGTFKPSRPVTRAEFAKMVVKAFNVTSQEIPVFTDVRKHWATQYINAVGKDYMTGYADGTFRPDRNITRAEAVNVITRLMKLGAGDEKTIVPRKPSFEDVPESYWAFSQIETANQIGILPNYETRFNPDHAADRAEASWMISKARHLDLVEGTVSSIDTGASKLTVLPSEGDLVEVATDLDTAMFRNNVGTTLDRLEEGDTVRAVVAADGTARYLAAQGVVNSNDLAGRASAFLKGKVTPEQIQAIMAGDWDSVKGNFKSQVYDEMLKYGATPQEAETILMADWSSLGSLGRDRLASSVAAQLGISPDMVTAIMDQSLSGLQRLSQQPQGDESGQAPQPSSVSTMAGALLSQLIQQLPKIW